MRETMHHSHFHRNGGLKVRLGETDGQSTSEMYPYKEYSIQKLVVHSNFNSVNLEDDVALLTLSGTVPISSCPNINTACFPSAAPAAGTKYVRESPSIYNCNFDISTVFLSQGAGCRAGEKMRLA